MITIIFLGIFFPSWFHVWFLPIFKSIIFLNVSLLTPQTILKLPLKLSELFSLEAGLQRKNVIHIRLQQSTIFEWHYFGSYKGVSLEIHWCSITLVMGHNKEVIAEMRWMDLMKPFVRWTLKHREWLLMMKLMLRLSNLFLVESSSMLLLTLVIVALY